MAVVDAGVDDAHDDPGAGEPEGDTQAVGPDLGEALVQKRVHGVVAKDPGDVGKPAHAIRERLRGGDRDAVEGDLEPPSQLDRRRAIAKLRTRHRLETAEIGEEPLIRRP